MAAARARRHTGGTAPPASSSLPSGPASASPIGAGPDVNNVPWELTARVREYFTPEPDPAGPASAGRTGHRQRPGAGHRSRRRGRGRRRCQRRRRGQIELRSTGDRRAPPAAVARAGAL